jgi:pimeloyl-ACP methyl ester carboxylesterase
LPGLTANCHIFDSIIKNGLGESGHLVAVDMRGRGQSGKPASGYSLACHADDVCRLMAGFSGREIVLVGHSFGGLVAAWLCANYPRLCKRLVLLDVSVDSTDPKVVEILKPSLSRLDMEFPSAHDYLEKMRHAPYLYGY